MRTIVFGCCLTALIAGALFLRPAAQAASAPPARDAPDFAAIDADVQAQMVEMHLPGLALGIVRRDQIVHLHGFGVADPSGRAVTSQTPFIIGSTTKSFTALAIMQLVEAGQLDLDAPVQRYLPWFRVADAAASAHMTLRELLNHTSGLPASAGYQPIFNVETGSLALEDGVRSLSTVQLDRPLGASYEYCNANYNILGLIVQSVAGQPYGQYVEDHIFVPLDMQHSFTSLETAQEASRP